MTGSQVATSFIKACTAAPCSVAAKLADDAIPSSGLCQKLTQLKLNEASGVGVKSGASTLNQ